MNLPAHENEGEELKRDGMGMPLVWCGEKYFVILNCFDVRVGVKNKFLKIKKYYFNIILKKH